MRKLLAALIAVTALLGATVAVAGISSGDDENDYEGRVEKDTNTYFGLDKNGAKVQGITAYIGYNCDNGEAFKLLLQSKGKLQIQSGKFAGKLAIDDGAMMARGSNSGFYKLRGKFGQGGEVKGTIDAEVFSGSLRCYSGRLDWKANKGVDLDAPVMW